jgi:amidohydrolase
MNIPELVELRRKLHQNPELSGTEQRTSGRIADEIRKFNHDEIIENLGGCGIAAIFNPADSTSDKTVVFRAELDALPVSEDTELPYRSKQAGVMHACGHDGHMTILTGLAKKISENPPRNKRIILLFQPSEETGRGAAQIMDDNRFKNLTINCGYALHNLPGYDENTIYVRYDTFACASVGVEVAFKGRSSHAAYPEQGVNPALAVSAFLQAIDHNLQHLFGEDTSGRYAVTFIKMGEPAFGMSPGEATVGITLRAARDKTMQEALKLIESLIIQLRGEFDGSVTFSQKEPFTAVVNDERGVNIIKNAARESGLKIEEIHSPFPWSEDFGAFREKFPITLFGIGAGHKSAPLHSERYDFNDNLIETGITIFEKIIELE